MSKKKVYRSMVYDFFEFNETSQKYMCKIENCRSSFKKHAGTLKQHLKKFHPEKFGEMLKAENDARLLKTNDSDGQIKLNISISPEGFRKSLVDLVSVHGRPFSLMDDAAFREIIDPILEALPPDNKFTVNRRSICNMVKISAADLRNSIADELNDIPLISLKIDIGTRHCRSFLGINIQFIKDSSLCLRTLAVTELTKAHTSIYLREVVKRVLQIYNIPLTKLYSLTSDSGSNMVKLNTLLENDQNHEIEGEEHCEDEEVENEPMNSEDEYTDSLHSSISEETNEDILVSCENCGFSILKSLRCGVHSLQLAVLEVLKNGPMQATIAKARSVVKCLRKDCFLKLLKRNNINKPVLDVVTRWSSTADMLTSLLAAKEFCKDLAGTNSELSLTDVEWERIENCLDALKPCKIATLRLQQENLLPGDFFNIWSECKLRTKAVDTPLARQLLEAIERREKPLLSNEALLASMYLDPRVLPFLSTESLQIAKQVLLNIWRMINSTANNTSKNNNAVSTSATDAEAEVSNDLSSGEYCTDLIDLERQRLEKERNKNRTNNDCSIEQKINDFGQVPSIPSKEDLLQYWEVRKFMMPELYTLAKIVHAVPMTQVSVERLFSGMRFIFSHLRANLSHDILEDILILRTNKNFLKRAPEGKQSCNKKINNDFSAEVESCATTQLIAEDVDFEDTE